MTNPSYWIPEEASEQEHLPYYVTFRAALISRLEDLVLPIWKNLLFLMDQNDNLLLLDEQKSYQQMWIDLLQLCFKSGSLLLDEEARCIEDGISTEKASFPFSLLIRNSIEKLLETRREIFKMKGIPVVK